ncbi:MAG: NAD(+)/NADH kinase [Muribaculaceae bacterium]|nr:NAD(+)/NADH kinase [Muribaculaceae bacterium]
MPIAIYGSRSQHEHIPALRILFARLHALRISTAIHPKLAWYLEERGVNLYGAAVTERIPSSTELVLSIGGDGTFLRAARWVADRELPILGVNTGHLGFLAGCRLPEVEEMLMLFRQGRTVIEKRMLLQVSCSSLPLDEWPYALNEVALQKEDTASMITVSAKINGQPLANYRADGLIISTPTGSTAYNLAAGGPIVEPTIDCMVITPVAPHTLTLRPLVAGADSRLQFIPQGRARDFRLSLDSRSYILPIGTKVIVGRAPFVTKLVRRSDSPFPSILSDKLLWGN